MQYSRWPAGEPKTTKTAEASEIQASISDALAVLAHLGDIFHVSHAAPRQQTTGATKNTKMADASEIQAWISDASAVLVHLGNIYHVSHTAPLQQTTGATKNTKMVDASGIQARISDASQSHISSSHMTIPPRVSQKTTKTNEASEIYA